MENQVGSVININLNIFLSVFSRVSWKYKTKKSGFNNLKEAISSLIQVFCNIDSCDGPFKKAFYYKNKNIHRFISAGLEQDLINIKNYVMNRVTDNFPLILK